MTNLVGDVRLAARTMRRNVGATVVIVLSLALGIGTNTALFALVNAVLLRKPAVARPDQLVVLYSRHNSSYPDYVDYQAGLTSFTGIVAHALTPMSFSDGSGASRIFGELVSANYFSELGVVPAIGRGFVAGDAEPGSSPVVVMSDKFWQSHLGADRNAIGRRVSLNGTAYEVIGVAPAGFSGTSPGLSPDLFVPLTQAGARPGTDLLQNRDEAWLELIGRLRPRVSIGQARRELRVVVKRLELAYPGRASAETRSASTSRQLELMPLGSGDPAMQRDLLPVSGVLFAMTGFVLLIACSNIANVLLARAVARQREMAIRVALGARRAQVVQQVLVEATLIALLAGAAALFAARGAIGGLLASRLPIAGPIGVSASIDVPVLMFTLAISLVSGVACGLIPALQATTPQLAQLIKSGDGGGTRGRRRLQGILVVAQVTICVVLLTAAALLVRSLWASQRVAPGFDADHVAAASVDLGLNGYDEARGRSLQTEIINDLARLPGVHGVAIAAPPPLAVIGDEAEGKRTVTLPGEVEPLTRAERKIDVGVVDTGFFDVMGIPVIAGRTFSTADGPAALPAVIINTALARRLWPGASPLGQRLSLSGSRGPFLTVVGVAAISRYRSVGEQRRSYIYLPLSQNYRPVVTVLVRTLGDPAELAPGLLRGIAKADAKLAAFDVKTMRQQIYDALFAQRAAVVLFGTTGIMGLVLALAGVYGVISYNVARRTRELGVRMALGATAADVRRLVIGDGVRLVSLGLLLGLPMAFGLSQVIRSVLYGVGMADPISYGGIVAFFLFASVVASYVPARRATRIDPVAATRVE